MARAPRTRYLRRGQQDRKRRGRHLKAFLKERSTTLNGTGAAKTFTASGDTLSVAAHGLPLNNGPFFLTTTGTLPAGLQLNTPYYVVAVPNAGALKLSTKRGGAPVTTTNAGTGTHTMTKSSSRYAIFDYLKYNSPGTVARSTDADNL